MGGSWSLKYIGFATLVLFSVQLSAADFDRNYDEDEKPWVEIDVQLPAFPEKENLIPFTVGAISDTQYLVDGNSLSVDIDGVVRYALVVISPAGAQTISYEGMRCATAERKLYAFGRSDKTWSRPRSNPWLKIRGGSNNHYVELYANYFCSIGVSSIANADDARRILRYKP